MFSIARAIEPLDIGINLPARFGEFEKVVKHTKYAGESEAMPIPTAKIKNGYCYQGPDGQVWKVLKIEGNDLWYMALDEAGKSNKWIIHPSTKQPMKISSFGNAVRCRHYPCPSNADKIAKKFRRALS